MTAAPGVREAGFLNTGADVCAQAHPQAAQSVSTRIAKIGDFFTVR